MTTEASTVFHPAAGTTHKAAAAARSVSLWLIGCAGMVFAMAIIGAITRLTESGLSITEWRPITGIIPPLTEAQWLVEFEKYRQIPEYKYVNRGMSLDEFKFIFFWEWFHRLWGRLIGIVFAVPFVWFWATGRLTPKLKSRGLLLLALGGLQGFMGWFMVQSGLTERTDVSHYRLAMHLSLAFVIFAALLWVAFDTLDPRPKGHAVPAAARLRRHLWWSLALVSATVVWGAFVAGLNAGFAYNTWPLMNGVFAPAEMWNLSPAALNLVENTAAVQFTHRWLAILTALVIWAYAWRALRAGVTDQGRRLAIALAAAIGGQVLLGISTLLTVVWLPVAAAHQGGALVVIALIIWALHELKRPAPAA
ncbi:MAG: hypothetical protein RLY86_906 [Pseudomonadota bacterium]